MYNQSLEQLIDAVIADGVITEQERNVVYKKAESLGIDQNEIEVYLNGRLEAFYNANNPRFGGKQGKVHTCPNCGMTLNSFIGKCPACGHELTDISSNSVVKDFQQKLDEIDHDRDSKSAINKGLSAVSSVMGADSTTKRKCQLIKTFPIPNSKADLIEFATLCLTNTSGDPRTASEMQIQDAWKAKTEQLATKAELLFPDDPQVKAIFAHIHKKQRAKNTKKILFIAIYILVVLAAFGGLGYFLSTEDSDNEKDQQELQSTNRTSNDEETTGEISIDDNNGGESEASL